MSLFTKEHHCRRKLQIMNGPRSNESAFVSTHPRWVWPSLAWHQNSEVVDRLMFLSVSWVQLTLWCQPMFLISKQPTTLVWLFAGWCLRSTHWKRGGKTYHIPRGDIIKICVSVKKKHNEWSVCFARTATCCKIRTCVCYLTQVEMFQEI
jgi:hypothetical protein